MVANNFAVAAKIVAAGLSVLPCWPPERAPTEKKKKAPLRTGGFHSASLDLSPWRDQPDWLVGLPTSGFWVMDVDHRPDNARPIEAVRAELAPLIGMSWCELDAVCGLIGQTPSGGSHYYWKATPGLAIRNDASDFCRGIDTRGHDCEGRAKGYIVVAGNSLSDGRAYRRIKGHFSQLSEAPLPLLWLAAFSTSERKNIESEPGLREKIQAAEPRDWRAIFTSWQTAKRAATHRLALSKSTGDKTRDAYRRWAVDCLNARARGVASLTDGRRHAPFKAGRYLAKWVAHDLLTQDEVLNVLTPACAANNGSLSKKAVEKDIVAGLALGRNDPLPELKGDRDNSNTSNTDSGSIRS